MNILPLSSTAALSSPLSAKAAAAASSSGSATQSGLASQNVFLQLLVAQLKNQDPSQPTDGTAFVTELAQFTTLQEDTQSATDLDTIVASLNSGATTTAAQATPAAQATQVAQATPAAPSTGTTRTSNF